MKPVMGTWNRRRTLAMFHRLWRVRIEVRVASLRRYGGTRAGAAGLRYSHVGLNQHWLCPGQQKGQVHQAGHGSFTDPVDKETSEGQLRTGIPSPGSTNHIHWVL